MSKGPDIPDLLSMGDFDENEYIEADANRKKGEAATATSPRKKTTKEESAPRKSPPSPSTQKRMHVIRLSSSTYAKLRIAKLIEIKLSGEDGTVSDYIEKLIEERVKRMPEEYVDLFRRIESLS